MSIPLIPPLTRSGATSYWVGAEALTEGPAYILGRPSTRYEPRWHRVRSGYRTAGGTTVWWAWCGPHLIADLCVAVDQLPTSQPVCGTCDGRADGADPNRPGKVYSPARLEPPTWCPSRRLYVPAGYNVGRCVACGQLAPLRAAGGPYNGHEIITRHQPRALVQPCPFHAWRSLIADGDTAICACRRAPNERPY